MIASVRPRRIALLMRNKYLTLSPAQAKAQLRLAYHAARQRWIDTFLSYGPEQLGAALRTLGVVAGDTLIVQSSFEPVSGFRGTASVFIDVVLDVLGPAGNLVMVTLPYGGSTLEYLRRGQRFDVRRTPSQMGLVTEVFRRRQGVRRSLHPTHPIAVCGPRAEWLAAGHERCEHAFGADSPYQKLVDIGAKQVLFNVDFGVIILFHYLEHQVRDRLDFPLYADEVFEFPVVDASGAPSTVTALGYSDEAVRRRRRDVLENEMNRRRAIRRARVGNSTILLAEAEALVSCVADMNARGVLFYGP